MAKATLRDVKSFMEFWGWTNGGGLNSMKFNDDGRIVGYHGDATWIKDVEEACAMIGRLAERTRSKGGL